MPSICRLLSKASRWLPQTENKWKLSSFDLQEQLWWTALMLMLVVLHVFVPSNKQDSHFDWSVRARCLSSNIPCQNLSLLVKLMQRRQAMPNWEKCWICTREAAGHGLDPGNCMSQMTQCYIERSLGHYIPAPCGKCHKASSVLGHFTTEVTKSFWLVFCMF